MASHTRIVRYATLLAASLLAACTEDYDSFVIAEPDAAAGGATSNGGAAGQAGATSNGGGAGQAGATSNGGAAGVAGQPGTGGASNGGASGQGGSSGGPQCKQVDEWCQDNNECCDQHCGRAQDDRDCYQHDRCVACNSDEQCPSGRCDNCGCVDKGTKGDSCNEDSDCQSNQCAGGKCG